MARVLGAKCRLCRREGERLYLKGARCHTVKCGVAKRAYPPGMHSFRRSRLSDYGIRLREKQKTKRIYGVCEKPFRTYFKEAVRQKGNTGDNLLVLLERRLDNVVHLLGFADGRVQARHFISHGHVLVNGRKVDIASYLVKPGMTISVSTKKKSQKLIRERMEANKGQTVPGWLTADLKKLEGNVVRMPAREDVILPIQDSYIVEFCSR